MSRDVSDELFWQAYRYAVGEFTDEESREFENFLESNLLAQEALAETVGIQAMVKAACELAPAVGSAPVGVQGSNLPNSPPLFHTVRRSHWQPAAAWTMLGAAACLAIMFAVDSPRRSNIDEPAPIAASQFEADARLLAALRIDDGEFDEEASRLVPPLAAHSETHEFDSADFNADELPGDETAGDVIAPDWLLAAVAESTGATTE